MSQRVLVFAIALLLVAAPSPAAQQRPAVLFATGWVHNNYVVRPMVALGLEVDACPPEKMADLLATRRYNVVVVTTTSDAQRKAVDAFLARGGGALACNPEGAWHMKDWPATNQWLAALGARPRWEVLQDGNKENLARDIMGCELSWTDRVSAPVNRGVRGLLTVTAGGTTGWEPPMSLDFAPAWTVVVRGAATHKGVREVRNDEQLQPWIPKEPLAGSPALMGLRPVGPGRLAVVGIRSHWLFTPPYNCPTAEAMLTAGAGGKPSDWLRLFANTIVWLAEPSLAAGMGGMKTPKTVLDPPVTPWEIPPVIRWRKPGPIDDMPQVQGLIGARTRLSSGTGTVAEYARAAKAARLQFLVFLEDSLKMDQGGWDRLVKECAAASDEQFAAVPGLTYEDAQGNHLYVFGDDVRFPKPHMLLADRRLATNQRNRTQAYFDYINELVQQHAINGFWNHRRNFLPPADYKLYNSFPIVSFEDGRPIDSALDDFLYLQGLGGCQAALALEFLSSPDQLARRAAEGWRVVAHRGLKDLCGRWHEGAWSFSGSGSQYITNGPQILVWESPNRLVGANGLWWRPDQWQYRLRLRVASEAGLKSVALHDGQRELFRRWLPGGAKTFEQELVLANCQQRGFTLVVEDLRGRRAVSMSFWNRNLNMEEFFCSDRCNFLGSARLRTAGGSQYWTPVGFSANMGITPSKGRLDMAVCPAVGLTANSPTLPIDGAPAGFPTARIQFELQVPGELPTLFAYPQTYMVGPEIAVGQADIRLGYDPAETGAKTTPLGHPYQQPQDGSGNAWGSWHRLIPTRKIEGFARTYAANWLTRGFRLGWHETRVKLKEPLTLDAPKGLRIIYAGGNWLLHSGGRRVQTAEGPFDRGTLFTLEDAGGSVVLMPMDGPIRYRWTPGKNGGIELFYQPGKSTLAQGEQIAYRVAFAGAEGGLSTEKTLAYAAAFGAAVPGKTAYAPQLARGKPLDNYLLWQVDAQGAAVEARLPKTDLPGFLTACVENLRDNWSVCLVDRLRSGPNFRALPIRDGRAYAELDLTEAPSDVFIGHPLVADNPAVKLLVSWQEPGLWFAEAHNPTDAPLTARLASAPGGPLAHFEETVVLPPGSSKTFVLPQRGAAAAR
ncbi:MAG: hypothetical protein ABSG86_15265 [Thermoguttaceae bacterium]